MPLINETTTTWGGGGFVGPCSANGSFVPNLFSFWTWERGERGMRKLGILDKNKNKPLALRGRAWVCM